MVMIPFKTLAIFTNLSYFISEIIDCFKFYIKITINSMSKFFLRILFILGKNRCEKLYLFALQEPQSPYRKDFLKLNLLF